MEKHRCKPSLTRCPFRGRNCCRPRSAGHKSSSDTHHDEEPVVRSSTYFYKTRSAGSSPNEATAQTPVTAHASRRGSAGLVLEANNEVVSVAHDDHVAHSLT